MFSHLSLFRDWLQDTHRSPGKAMSAMGKEEASGDILLTDVTRT